MGPSHMVAAEVETQIAPPTEAAPASTDELTLAPTEGQDEAGKGQDASVQGQEATPTPGPEPTEQEQLDAALAVREAASRGEAARALTDREKVLLRADDDRRITYENMARDAVERQRTTARELANAHTAHQTKVTAAFESAMAEAVIDNDDKIVLPASTARLLEKEIQEADNELAAKSAPIHLTPWLTHAADVVHAVLENSGVMKDLYPRGSSDQVLQQLYSLPLVSSDGSPSIVGEAYRTGWAAAKRAGPTPGSQSFTVAELAAHDKEVRESELAKVRGGGQPGNQGADGAKGGSSATWRTLEEARNLHAQGLLPNAEMRRIERDPSIPEGYGRS